ncbi:13221_t:CDS:2 [Gigaspora rosea]|nr:13221_t:CDS:2 [Gigaspora rosea]
MDTFLFLKEEVWVEKFCQACYNLTFSAEGLRSAADIQLLSIIVEVFPQLFTRHSIYFSKFLSQTTFVTPLADSDLIFDSEIVSLLPIQHLSYFGTYNQLSTKTSLIETFFAKIMYYWNKLIVSVNEIHKLILKIQAGDWHSFDRPFLPQILLKAIQIQTDEIEPDYKEC